MFNIKGLFDNVLILMVYSAIFNACSIDDSDICYNAITQKREFEQGYPDDRSLQLADPNGVKITIMLEETALPYTAHPIDITKGNNSPTNFYQSAQIIKFRHSSIMMVQVATISPYLNPAPS